MVGRAASAASEAIEARGARGATAVEEVGAAADRVAVVAVLAAVLAATAGRDRVGRAGVAAADMGLGCWRRRVAVVAGAAEPSLEGAVEERQRLGQQRPEGRSPEGGGCSAAEAGLEVEGAAAAAAATAAAAVAAAAAAAAAATAGDEEGLAEARESAQATAAWRSPEGRRRGARWEAAAVVVPMHSTDHRRSPPRCQSTTSDRTSAWPTPHPTCRA